MSKLGAQVRETKSHQDAFNLPLVFLLHCKGKRCTLLGLLLPLEI